jgi:serine/threonine protein kinase
MSDELIGKTVNGYEVLSVIGRGGMATVYAARQQSMNRTIALKVLPRQFVTDDTYLQRFEREVRIVSQLEHRNIIPVYDYGEWDGLPYIAMRYMPAGSVDDLLRHGAMSMTQVLNIITQIAPALDYAHSKEVLHRDLKPSNVLLDEADGAFLTDFGIARLANDKQAGITTQGVVGTPSYMSPEQAQGRELDGRSDVYALGVMLFEMATGRRPFESDTPYSIAVMQVTEEPPSPRSIHPNVPFAVERVILKALRKDPASRYQTAQALAEALKQAIEAPESLTTDTEPRALNVPANTVPSSPASPPQSPPVPAPVSPPMSAPVSAPISSSLQGAPGVERRGFHSPYGIRDRIKKRRQTNPLLGLLLGGAMGCGMLLVIVVVGIIAVGTLLSGGEATPATPASTLPAVSLNATQTGISVTRDPALPTLDATSESARATLIARNIANDATATASASTPVASFITPVGEREAPTLRPDLRGVRGEIVYADRRRVDGTSYFQIIRLNLETWEENILTNHPSDNSYPLASPDGRWVAFQSNRDGDFEIFVMNALGGQLVQLTDNDLFDRLAAWSPDGEWVIYSSDLRDDGTFDLYRTRLDGSETQLVYSNNQRISHARYSPDGRYLVFTMGADPQNADTWEIARLDLQTNELIELTSNSVRDASPVFHDDGERILYITFIDNNNAIAEMDIDGRNSRVIYDSAGSDWSASYSPDGRYIIFTSNLSGDDQLYLMTSDGEGVQQLTTDGGNYPSWLPNTP